LLAVHGSALLLFAAFSEAAIQALHPAGEGAALLGSDTVQLALRLAPAMLAGIWVGQRAFVGVSPLQFRRQVLNLLALIAGLSVLRALWALSAT
jgi:uncharacterized protein